MKKILNPLFFCMSLICLNVIAKDKSYDELIQKVHDCRAKQGLNSADLSPEAVSRIQKKCSSQIGNVQRYLQKNYGKLDAQQKAEAKPLFDDQKEKFVKSLGFTSPSIATKTVSTAEPEVKGEQKLVPIPKEKSSSTGTDADGLAAYDIDPELGAAPWSVKTGGSSSKKDPVKKEEPKTAGAESAASQEEALKKAQEAQDTLKGKSAGETPTTKTSSITEDLSMQPKVGDQAAPPAVPTTGKESEGVGVKKDVAVIPPGVTTDPVVIPPTDSKTNADQRTVATDPASKEEAEELEVRHSNYKDCQEPQWYPGLPERIIAVDNPCSKDKSERLAACLKHVTCKSASGAQFLRQALCEPAQCREGIDPLVCLKSNHAIFVDPSKASSTIFKKDGTSLMETEGRYKIRAIKK